MSRSWDEIVTDLEGLTGQLNALTDEARDKADEDDVAPPDSDAIYVAPGEPLQPALDAAPEGAVVELEPGATYTGRLMLRKAVTLQTKGAAITGRVSLDDAGLLALLCDGFEVPIGARDITVARVAIGGKNLNDITTIGYGDDRQTTLDQQPSNVTLDQVIIRGHPTDGAKRGISAHARNLKVLRSHICDIFRAGQDTQTIGGWNGEGPFLIDDCYLAAAGENIMFGGDEPKIPGLVPSDIEICRCTITKPMAWKGTSYTVKNLIEFKAGKRIYIHDNELSNSWAAGQAYALVITPSTPDGKNPSVTVEDYRFEKNTVLNVANAFNILGHGQNQDTRPTQTSARITIRDNWFQISKKDNGSNGWFLMMGNGPRELVVEHNTIQMDGNQYIQGNSHGRNTGAPGFKFIGNIVQNIGAYGTSLYYNGTDQKRGAYWHEYFAPDGVMNGGAFAGDDSTFKKNLPDNLHVSVADAAGLVVDGYGVGAFEGYGRRR